MNTQTDNSTDDNLTIAQRLFHDKDLINERPEGMPFEQYKAVRYLQSKMLKKMFRHKPDRRIVRLMEIRPGYNSH